MPSITSIYNSGVLLEFLNQNMHRNYPIQDTCVVKTTDGIYLPSSLLVNCQIIVPCENLEDIDASRFFVSDVMQYTSSLQVIISYQPENGTAFQCACSSAIVLSDQVYIEEVNLTPAAEVPDDSPLRNLAGKLWIGSTVNMSNLGSLHFSYADAALNAACIYKTAATKVSKLIIVSGDQSVEVDGDVTLVAGTGITLNYDATTKTVTIGADTTWLDNEIAAALQSMDQTAIRTINGQKPDSNGNFTISGLDCTDIKAVQKTNSITISNPCSKPCCGDDSGDVADIKSTQKTLQAKVDRVSENLNSFINSINNVETRLPSLVASRK